MEIDSEEYRKGCAETSEEIYCSECQEEIDRCEECEVIFEEDEEVYCNELKHYCGNCFNLLTVR